MGPEQKLLGFVNLRFGFAVEELLKVVPPKRRSGSLHSVKDESLTPILGPRNYIGPNIMERISGNGIGVPDGIDPGILRCVELC